MTRTLMVVAASREAAETLVRTMDWREERVRVIWAGTKDELRVFGGPDGLRLFEVLAVFENVTQTYVRTP